MHQHYTDILDRIVEPLKWFDEAAVPCYGAFAPADLADMAALAEISCLASGTRFQVAMTGGFADEGLSLGDMILLARVQYGDPPNTCCCAAGPTMNSETYEIVE